ncbi:RNA-binding domain-containing protein [Backusella circina FSU 941]|nr:RNA-binding domain-containing protein [Backusella circina FSU 941]
MGSRSPDRMNVDDEIKIKGRGFNNDSSRRNRGSALDEGFLEPSRSIEGWIIVVRGLHEETDEEGLTEKFMEYGVIKNVHLNLDRRTGYVKGYALIEYETRREAEIAIEQANGSDHLGEKIKVDFAFVKGPNNENKRESRRDRSMSPDRNH